MTLGPQLLTLGNRLSKISKSMQFPLTFHIVCHDGLQNKCKATHIHKASAASKKEKKKISHFQFVSVSVVLLMEAN